MTKRETPRIPALGLAATNRGVGGRRLATRFDAADSIKLA
jgi:hypothetical protein